MLWIPPRQINAPEGGGTQIQGGKPSRPIDLKVNYTIGRDTPPIEYIGTHVDFTIKTAMSGDIGLEMTSDDKRRHSIELAMSKNPIQIKQKLSEIYDPALCALTAKPVMVFESGKVKIKAPLATAANAGPFAIGLQSQTPNHLSGTLSPPTLNGTVKVDKTNYKFSADISLSAEVIWHPKPKGMNEVPVQVRNTEQVKVKADKPTSTTDWGNAAQYADEFVAVVTITIMSYFVPAIRAMVTQSGATTSMMPFTHSIDARRYGYPGDA